MSALFVCSQEHKSSQTDPAHTRNKTCKQPAHNQDREVSRTNIIPADWRQFQHRNYILVTFQCKQGRAQITICKAVVLYMQPMVAVGLQTLQSTKAWLEVWECHGAATQELGEHSCHWLKSEVDSRHCRQLHLTTFKLVVGPASPRSLSVIYVMNSPPLFCFRVLLSTQTEERKKGQAWEQG